jgi:hypothetical protein
MREYGRRWLPEVEGCEDAVVADDRHRGEPAAAAA